MQQKNIIEIIELNLLRGEEVKIRIGTFNSLKELTQTVLIRRPLLRSEEWRVQGSW